MFGNYLDILLCASVAAAAGYLVFVVAARWSTVYNAVLPTKPNNEHGVAKKREMVESFLDQTESLRNHQSSVTTATVGSKDPYDFIHASLKPVEPDTSILDDLPDFDSDEQQCLEETPAPLSLVKFDCSDLPPEYHNSYPMKTGDLAIFFGEIPNMPGHCVVSDQRTGKILSGFHTELFKPIEDD